MHATGRISPMDGRGEGRDDAWGYPHPTYDAQDLSLIAFGYWA